ncbi:MAG: hypothetical protein ACYTAF_14190 [Planctomycetota bacterium]|jgi:hypothetical protein
MIRGLLAGIPALLLLACGSHLDFGGEPAAAHYGPGVSDTEEEYKIDQKEIWVWEADPNKRRLIGLIEHYKYRPKGMRVRPVREWHDYYLLYPKDWLKPSGHINHKGQFFRYRKKDYRNDSWDTDFVGEFEIFVTGLKVFYGLKHSINMDLIPIDPYGY